MRRAERFPDAAPAAPGRARDCPARCHRRLEMAEMVEKHPARRTKPLIVPQSPRPARRKPRPVSASRDLAGVGTTEELPSGRGGGGQSYGGRGRPVRHGLSRMMGGLEHRRWRHRAGTPASNELRHGQTQQGVRWTPQPVSPASAPEAWRLPAAPWRAGGSACGKIGFVAYGNRVGQEWACGARIRKATTAPRTTG